MPMSQSSTLILSGRRPKKFYTRGSHSPFVGRELTGKPVLTIVDGKVVMKDGVVL